MKQQASFVGWDFNSVWQITEGVDYPKLTGQFVICDSPSVPAGISATDGAYNNYIRVTWNSALGATGYEVWRNTSNNSGTAIKSGDYTSPYDDSNVISGTTYYYWVKAANNCGTSDFSSSAPGYASQTVSIIKCTVAASSKVNSDRISFSGKMNATAVDFNDANNSSDANWECCLYGPLCFYLPGQQQDIQEGYI